MKILGFLPDPGGCGFYRMRQPLEWLTYAGHEVRWFLPADLMSITSERTALLRWAEVVLCQRMASAELMEMLRDYCRDAKIVYDLDDFYWDLPYENQARLSINEAKLNELARAMSLADVVTASTPYLQELLRRFHPRVELVRNALDPTFIRTERPENPCLRIGWAGSITHRVDLEPMIKGLRMAMDANREMAAVFMGADARLLASQLPHGRTYYHDPVQVDHYMTVLGRINLDIGLAPIRDHEFNRAKSEVKHLEYTAAGAMTIASDVGPYQEAIEHKKTGMLVRHHDFYAWRDAILEAAASRELMEELVKNARAKAVERNGASKWAEKLGGIFSRDEKPAAGIAAAPNVRGSVTAAILNWVPEPGPRLDTLIECLPRTFARLEELACEADLEVVIRDQGSCAEATLWLLQEVLHWRARGLKITVETRFENRGIQVLNEICRDHPATFLLKIDNDVLIPPGGLVHLVRTWRELETRWRMGMLGLDVAWTHNETFATRESGKCVSDRVPLGCGEVFLMKPSSVVIGQCRLESMSRLRGAGGYPARMYGTDQPNADAYSERGLVNAHLLVYEEGLNNEVRMRPMIHRGVEETEGVSEFKRSELKKAVGMA